MARTGSQKRTGRKGCKDLARKRKREFQLKGPEMKTYQTRGVVNKGMVFSIA